MTEHKVRRFAMHFLLGLIGRGAACLAYARSEAVRGRHAVWPRRQAKNCKAHSSIAYPFNGGALCPPPRLVAAFPFGT